MDPTELQKLLRRGLPKVSIARLDLPIINSVKITIKTEVPEIGDVTCTCALCGVKGTFAKQLEQEMLDKFLPNLFKPHTGGFFCSYCSSSLNKVAKLHAKNICLQEELRDALKIIQSVRKIKSESVKTDQIQKTSASFSPENGIMKTEIKQENPREFEEGSFGPLDGSNKRCLSQSTIFKPSVLQLNKGVKKVKEFQSLRRGRQKEERERCYFCHKELYKRESEHHYWGHTNENPFICNKCGKSFRRVLDFQRHKSLVCGTPAEAQEYHTRIEHLKVKNNLRRNYTCYFCPYKQTKFTELRYHINRHTKEVELFKCRYCNKTMESRGSLWVHEQLACGSDKLKQAKLIEKLRKHQKATRQKELANGVNCTKCGQHFKSSMKRFEHSYTNCGTSEEKIAELKRRKNMHARRKYKRDSEKGISCKNCKEKFVSSSGCWNHQKVCGKGRRKCAVCGKHFDTLLEKRKHEKLQHGSCLYTCYFCKLPFKDKTQAMLHTATHTMEKGFQCEVCRKRFSSYISLHHHRLRVCKFDKDKHEKGIARGRQLYSMNRYACEICSGGFGNSERLKDHMRKCGQKGKKRF